MERKVSTVCVDFDGVLHSYERGWADGSIYGTWIEGSKEALQILMEHYAVAVFSTRTPTQIACWLAGHGFDTVCDVEGPRRPPRVFWNEQGCLFITNRKIAAAAYIDDRGIRFTDWPSTLGMLGLPHALVKESS